MLFGMAFELMFKAISVVSDNDLAFSHNLADLAQEAGIQFTDQEIALFKILTEYVIWGGRYPVPKNKKTFQTFDKIASEALFDKINCGGLDIMRSNHLLDWENLNRIWKKVRHQFSVLYESKQNTQKLEIPKY